MQYSVSKAIDSTKTGKPTVQIKHTALAGEGLARVVVEVTHAGKSREDHAMIATALNAATNNKLRVVAGTFRSVAHNRFSDTLVGVMSVNRQIKPYTDNLEGFKSVSSNMFMDTEKNMWALEETASGKMLVKQSDEDRIEGMREMLSSLCGNSPFKAEASAKVNVQGGDFCAYVTKAGTTAFGFVVAEVANEDAAVVLPTGTDEVVEIAKDAVVMKVEGEDLPIEEEADANEVIASARGKVGIQEMIEYYRRLYGKHPQFFKQLVDRINSHSYM